MTSVDSHSTQIRRIAKAAIFVFALIALVILVIADQLGPGSPVASDVASETPTTAAISETMSMSVADLPMSAADIDDALRQTATAQSQEQIAQEKKARDDAQKRKQEAEAAAKAEEDARKEAEKRKAQEEKAAKAEKLQLSLSESSQGSLDENAKKVYSILKSAGIPDINIAGVLGNWESESRIDPTSIEGIYNEMYHIGKRKAEALIDPAAQARNCFARYARTGLKINKKAYVRKNGELWPGIGIGGFTGPAIDPLLSWSEKIGKPWYSLEAQVSYAIKGYGRAKWLASWTKESKDATQAVADFLHNWEGCHVSYAKRAEQARKWLARISTWSPDIEYGKSVLSLGD